jgi:hypothetical protein
VFGGLTSPVLGLLSLKRGPDEEEIDSGESAALVVRPHALFLCLSPSTLVCTSLRACVCSQQWPATYPAHGRQLCASCVALDR